MGSSHSNHSGLRIQAISNTSPLLHKANVFTDVIVSINKDEGFTDLYMAFANLLLDHVKLSSRSLASPIKIQLYNIHESDLRLIEVVPDLDSSQMSELKIQEQKYPHANTEEEKTICIHTMIELYLGTKFKMENLSDVRSKIVRCTNVSPKSPGFNAEIMPKFDFIVDC